MPQVTDILTCDSEDFFRQLADTVPQIVWSIDPGGRFVFCNRHGLSYLGIPHVSAIPARNRRMSRYVPREDWPSIRTAWQRAREEGSLYCVEHRIRAATGEYRWFSVRAAPQRDPAKGQILRWFGTAIDLHDRKLAEQAQLASEEHYRRLFDSIAHGLCVIEVLFDETGRSTGGRVLQGNRACELLTGKKQVVGSVLREILPGLGPSEFELYGRVALTGESVRVRQEAKPVGRCYDVSAFRFGPSSAHQVAILFTDITERWRVEEELQRSSRRKDDFLAMLAHELRNPLAPIATAAQILRLAGGSDEERVHRTADIIARQVNHITTLVDELLDVARLTRGQVALQREVLDLQEVVDNAIEQVKPLLETKRHRLTVQAAAEPVHVHGDRIRLVQIIANLLNNAAKYTPDGGTIRLALETEPGRVRLSVSDNGIGIAADFLPCVFDLFAQAERSPARSQGGLGLGLSLVKSIAELHGGTASAESAGPGRGARVAVELPRLPLKPYLPPLDETVVMRAAHDRQLRVMIVDDNEDAATLLGQWLESQGHLVSIAHRATVALDLARELQPDVFILDIGLPDIDGYALAQQLRHVPECETAVLIALTGYGQQQDRARSAAAGFDHHMVKPADSVLLCALLKDVAAGRVRPRNPLR